MSEELLLSWPGGGRQLAQKTERCGRKTRRTGCHRSQEKSIVRKERVVTSVRWCWADPEDGFRSMVTLARSVMMVSSRRETWLGPKDRGMACLYIPFRKGGWDRVVGGHLVLCTGRKWLMAWGRVFGFVFLSRKEDLCVCWVLMGIWVESKEVNVEREVTINNTVPE